MGLHSWQRLQLEQKSGGRCVWGACVICSENLQLGSFNPSWSVGLKIINQFFGMKVTETQLKGNFSLMLSRRMWAMSFRCGWIKVLQSFFHLLVLPSLHWFHSEVNECLRAFLPPASTPGGKEQVFPSHFKVPGLTPMDPVSMSSHP